MIKICPGAVDDICIIVIIIGVIVVGCCALLIVVVKFSSAIAFKARKAEKKAFQLVEQHLILQLWLLD